MKSNVICVGVLTSFVLISFIQAQENDFPVLKGPYLGQKPPGMKPELFAPGIIPSSNYHTAPAFTDNGKEAYWKMMGSKNITMIRFENGTWSAPKEISLSSKLDDFRDPSISPDGKKLFFLSKGKLSFQKGTKENIWFAEKTAQGWSEPQPLGEEVNLHELHWQVSVAENGNLYLTSRNTGVEDIYCAEFLYGHYQTPEKLIGDINTPDQCETTPYISRDESILIYARWKPHSAEPARLYISFRKEDGTWSQSRIIEIVEYGISPQLSPDGKYMFYLGGDFNCYWVSAKIIEELRPKE